MMQQQKSRPARVSSSNSKNILGQTGGSTSSQNRFNVGPKQSIGSSFANKENVNAYQRHGMGDLHMNDLGSMVLDPADEDSPPRDEESTATNNGQYRSSTASNFEVSGPAADRTTWHQECQHLVEQIMANQRKLSSSLQSQVASKKRVEQILVPVSELDQKRVVSETRIRDLKNEQLQIEERTRRAQAEAEQARERQMQLQNEIHRVQTHQDQHMRAEKERLQRDRQSFIDAERQIWTAYLDATAVTWTEPEVPVHETPRSRKVRGMVQVPDMPVQHFELHGVESLDTISDKIWQRIEMATGLRSRLGD
eukprot:gene474-381_t